MLRSNLLYLSSDSLSVKVSRFAKVYMRLEKFAVDNPSGCEAKRSTMENLDLRGFVVISGSFHVHV